MKRPTLKRIALILGALALLAVAAVGVFVASEWTYISRMRSHPANSILDVAWYQPKEAVPGVRIPCRSPSRTASPRTRSPRRCSWPRRRTPPPCWSSTRAASSWTGTGTATSPAIRPTRRPWPRP